LITSIHCNNLEVIGGLPIEYENKTLNCCDLYRFYRIDIDNDSFSLLKCNITQYSNLRDVKFTLNQYIKVQNLLQSAKCIQMLVIYDESIPRNISDLVDQLKKFPKLTVFNTNHYFDLDSLDNTTIKHCLVGPKRNLLDIQQNYNHMVNWQTSCTLKSLYISFLGVTNNSVIHFPDS